MAIHWPMADSDWLFATDSSWRARLTGRPRGDSTAAWTEVAIPQIVAEWPGRAVTPAIVVVHVEAAGNASPQTHAKALLDALHDDCRSGPWYREFGVAAPLPGDDPHLVAGLAIEVRHVGSKERVTYSAGQTLRVRGTPLATIDVPVAAPNDIAGDKRESAKIALARTAFVEAVADAWRRAGHRPLEVDRLGLVVRHRPSRDEDNTWATWISALKASSTWSVDAWGGIRPLGAGRIGSIASVSDPSLPCQVRYEIYEHAERDDPGLPVVLAAPTRSGSARGQAAARPASGSPDELLTVHDYRAAIGRGGFIVITDSANPTKAHRPSCPHVTLERVTKKVVENGRRNGRYYWVATEHEAKAKYKARLCPVCN